MKPHCPICQSEMTPFAISHNTFNCAPCREIIKFFGVAAPRNEVKQDTGRPARRAA